MSIKFISSCKLPTPFAEFKMYAFLEEDTGLEHLLLGLGDVSGEKPVLARVHSECLTGDSLFSIRCDCGSQLEKALRLISREGHGVLLYLRQEGRGIGLLNKIKAYNLQDKGIDTVEANKQLGFSADERDYSVCIAMLRHLSIHSLRLLTNNPEKVKALSNMGIKIFERVALETGKNPCNYFYLKTKAEKMGHIFSNL